MPFEEIELNFLPDYSGMPVEHGMEGFAHFCRHFISYMHELSHIRVVIGRSRIMGDGF